MRIIKTNKLNHVAYAAQNYDAPQKPNHVFISSAHLLAKDNNCTLLLRTMLQTPECSFFTYVICVPSAYTENYYAWKAEYPQMDLKFVTEDSKEYIDELFGAQYVISDGRLPSYYIKPEKQIHFNLIHFDFEQSNFSAMSKMHTAIGRNLLQTSVLLYPNQEALEKLRTEFHLDLYFKGSLLQLQEPCAPILQWEAQSAELEEPAFSQGKEDAMLVSKKICADIISAMLHVQQMCHPFVPVHKKHRILYLLNLQNVTVPVLNLCNQINQIDYTQNEVCVLAIDTYTTKGCGYITNNAHILFRHGELAATETERDAWDELNVRMRTDEQFTVEIESNAHTMWQRELKRVLGGMEFDEVILYQMTSLYWFAIVQAIFVQHRTYITDSPSYLEEKQKVFPALYNMISKSFDSVLMGDLTGIERIPVTAAQLPIAFSDKWNAYQNASTDFDKCLIGSQQYDCINSYKFGLSKCSLLPVFQAKKRHYLAIAKNGQDAQKIMQLFHAQAEKEAILYLVILSITSELKIESKQVLVIPDHKLSILLLSKCDCFVDFYGECAELTEIARLLHLSVRGGVRTNQSGNTQTAAGLDETIRLAFEGPPEDTLYFDYDINEIHGDLAVGGTWFGDHA